MKTRNRMMALLIALTLTLTSAACAPKTGNPGSISGTTPETGSEIKNVILMLSDGTSVDVSTLSRWYKAYDGKGGFDTETRLHADPYASGLIRTYWMDETGTPGAIADSAPGATAYSTGYKTQDKFVGTGPDGKPRATLLELAESLGKSTGLVATVNMQHATPAAFAAHTTDRSDYEGIAAQMLESGVDVVLGGGAKYMRNRADGRDLIAELKAQGYAYLTNREELAAFAGDRAYGLFAPDFLAYDIDRPLLAPEEPSLGEMTEKAISILSKNEKGFFLLVEGSKVDWSAHNNDPAAVVSEFLAFDKAVQTAMDFAGGREDTMVLVVEDHGTGGISIGSEASNATYSSYPLSDIIGPLHQAKITGNGAIKLLAQGKDASQVLELMGITDPTADELAWLSALKPEPEAATSIVQVMLGRMLSKRCNIGWTTTGHTGEDVVLYSYLPGDGRLTGLFENTDITRFICDAFGATLSDGVCRHDFK